ncbi:MAG: YgiT-type zinc finger protein [Nitrospirota bacterium]
MMILFKKCPICGGDMLKKDVEKLLHGGGNTAIMRVEAEVCLHCGERLYPQEIVRQFEQIRKKLMHKDVSGLQAVGQSFQVAKS